MGSVNRLLREDTREDRKPSEKSQLRDRIGLLEDVAFSMAAEKNHEIQLLQEEIARYKQHIARIKLALLSVR